MVPVSRRPVETPKTERATPSTALSKAPSGINRPTAMTEPGMA